MIAGMIAEMTAEMIATSEITEEKVGIIVIIEKIIREAVVQNPPETIRSTIEDLQALTEGPQALTNLIS
jgi:hypothetical protein